MHFEYYACWKTSRDSRFCFSVTCAVTREMGGEQTNMWTDWREEEQGMDSLDWRWQASSGKTVNLDILHNTQNLKTMYYWTHFNLLYLNKM